MTSASPQYRGLVDASGNPLRTDADQHRINELRGRLQDAKRDVVRARYDASQTVTANQQHWSNADHLDPHNAASLKIRRILRSRSRYEVIENNPYLKGICLTICNDFVGRSGPKLKLIDKRLSRERRQVIEQKFFEWCKLIKLRQKVWQMRMAKITDGESFLRSYTNTNRRLPYPVTLDFQVIECDRVSSYVTMGEGFMREGSTEGRGYNEIDGLRFDEYENPLSYHLLHKHPGSSMLFHSDRDTQGTWVPSHLMLHWFRKDRTWLRGIPELTPSLPLCALLRRYTLAIVAHAEVAADLTAIISSDAPPGFNNRDAEGNIISDDPFEVFNVEHGTIMNLPYGYTMQQLNAVPLGVQYDEFVGSLLREITRPILVPFNMQVGTSKDSNMASAVVDRDVYRSGQEQERVCCEEDVLSMIFQLWWEEARLAQGYLGDNFLGTDPQFRAAPLHSWGWDRIGQDHTDPSKVASYLKTLHDEMKVMTDRDVQETYFNRDVEDWRAEVKDDAEFRKELLDAGLMMDVEEQAATVERGEKSKADHAPPPPKPVAPKPAKK